MNTYSNDDFRLETYKDLLADVLKLREGVVRDAGQRLTPFKKYYPRGHFSHSARNLAHYLALRQRDMRPLQDRLVQAGLSSLGHIEPQVLTTSNRVIELLTYATAGDDEPSPAVSDQRLTDGSLLLRQRTSELFGPHPRTRPVYIMVTLPSEAAWDYELIRGLMMEGMDCARINCAHDDTTAWQAMINNVRRAEAETRQNCKILMDLAGHKIRTGPLATLPAVRRLRVQRDVFGRIINPSRVLLVADSQAEVILPEEADTWLAIPQDLHQQLAGGDRLSFADSRGKDRCLQIIDPLGDGNWLAHCAQSTYLASDAILTWQRRESAESDHWQTQGKFTVCPFPGQPVTIRLRQGDPLLLGRTEDPGQPAVYGDDGQVLTPARIGCTCAAVIDDLKPGAPVWIDDGKLGTVVEKITAEGALLRVTHAGPRGVRIRNDKGINLPETRLHLPPLSDKDRQDLEFVCQHADMVGFSFVETLQDMERLIEVLTEQGAPQLPIIAKIETNRAVRNLPDIILGTLGRHTMGIMIARGDLAVELGSVRMSEIQEEILWVCEAAHIPVIWATQVLESLAKKGTISRPEITDAASGVRAECVMLNKGPYILRAVQVLGHILSRMQEHQQKKFTRLRALHW
ncbi:MAG: pyruvate kinase [Candidatus Competibacteraceae bacterium]